MLIPLYSFLVPTLHGSAAAQVFLQGITPSDNFAKIVSVTLWNRFLKARAPGKARLAVLPSKKKTSLWVVAGVHLT
jgi:hypothetical protein